ncbi:uncharacterized protein C19orf44 homolog [Callorhinchus milii]|uniref:uncharacterized protein C19orf44 homolog n=1 Tax=Callorhinchus milii TaxID=7868 RepID=UPI001C3FBCCE|nr:uncharacterized protein C19orf44 homolog [Callorhinchus milii]XP_007899242.2 uncharacterized protein C19orf44 homolog [Callorhinchus milii]
MFRKSELRSSALARAHTQLSGLRASGRLEDSGDELKDFINILSKKHSGLEVDLFNMGEVSDISELSADDTTDRAWKRNLNPQTLAILKPAEDFAEPPLSGNRFLKKQNMAVVSHSPTISRSVLKKTSDSDVRRPNTASTRIRSSSAALARLAQIENKIMNRRLGLDTSKSDEDPRGSDEGQISAQTSSELSERGSRFLKRTSQLTETKQSSTKGPGQAMGSVKKVHPKAQAKTEVTIDSDEEELRMMLGGSLELSDEIKHEPGSKGAAKLSTKLYNETILNDRPKTQTRMPSPPSRGSPQTAWSPRLKFVKRPQSPLSERSEVKSLDELFTEPSVAEDISSLDGNSDDFRVNIMSLEDLVQAPEATSTPKMKRRQASADQRTEPGVRTSRQHTADKRFRTPPASKRLPQDKGAACESDAESEILTANAATENEISEHLNEDSTTLRGPKGLPERQEELSEGDDAGSLFSSEAGYSEDFDESERRVAALITGCSDSSMEPSHREELTTPCSDSSESYSTISSRTPDTSSQSSYLLRRKTDTRRKKVTLKDIAIQTQVPGFTYSWPKGEGVAVLGPSFGTSYLDPTPIASHVVSPEAMEALTSYSPAVFALNDMLKQQLLLTRQFVDISHHLHLSLVTSLEQDSYHYTTLEETQEFVKAHMSPPLTFDQALEEVLQEMKEYHYI